MCWSAGMKQWAALVFVTASLLPGCGQEEPEYRGTCFYQCVCYYSQLDVYDSVTIGYLRANNESRVFDGEPCDVFAAEHCELTAVSRMGDRGDCKLCRYHWEDECVGDFETGEFAPEGCAPAWFPPLVEVDEFCISQYQQAD